MKPRRQWKWTVEMTVYGKPGKRWNCFPPFPQTLEIDKTDSHIPTAGAAANIENDPERTKNKLDRFPSPFRLISELEKTEWAASSAFHRLLIAVETIS